MNRPYIICHMMTSVDGRIDCEMVGKLEGVQEYYSTLHELKIPTTLSGRVTAMLELALPGKFEPKDTTPLGCEAYSKVRDAEGYEVITDTNGTLLWKDDIDETKPHLIITSEKVSKDYIDYLNKQHISWIACGKDKIDLVRAMEILASQFGVQRMGVVGGPIINTAFLKVGLLDEISILIGLGIDGRKNMPPVFDGLPMDQSVFPLKLKHVQAYDNGAVWLRYDVI